jgi:hypothetical protein
MIDNATEAPLSAEAGDYSRFRSEVNSASHSLESGNSSSQHQMTGREADYNL